MTQTEAVWKFLEEIVPGSSNEPGAQRDWWDDWNNRCKTLPPVAPIIFIEALREKAWQLHYAALLGLRHHGYEAWADGHSEETIYKIKKKGDANWAVIVPKYTPTATFDLVVNTCPVCYSKIPPEWVAARMSDAVLEVVGQELRNKIARFSHP
jgi:hypothetical protein